MTAILRSASSALTSARRRTPADLQYRALRQPAGRQVSVHRQVSYDLPIGAGRAVNLNGAANAALGGWTANTIVYLSTGIPIPAPGSGTPIGYFNQRADVLCNPGIGAPHTAATWINYKCFTAPGVPAGSFDITQSNPLVAGNAHAYLDGVRTAGARDVDVSLYKEFKFGEDRVLRFEASSYNLFNHAQFGMPNITSMGNVYNQILQNPTPFYGAPTNFGQVTATVNSPRQFQFGSRFTF